jgi:hypothetical protein
MCAEDDDDQNYRYNPRSITGRDGFLSKAFGLALSSYLAVGAYAVLTLRLWGMTMVTS